MAAEARDRTKIRRAGRWGGGPRRLPQQLAVASTALAVTVFAVTGWSMRFPAQAGRPVERPAAGAARTPADAVEAQALRDGIDVDQVVDTVRHRMGADRSGALASEDATVGMARGSTSTGVTPGAEQPVSEPVTAPSFLAQSGGSVAFDGVNYLVVWTDFRAGFDFTISQNADVYATRVSRAGVVLDDTGIPIATGPGEQGANDVVYDGTDYLVTWDDRYSGSSDVHGTLISRDGDLLGSSFLIATGERVQNGSAVSYDGTNHLVVWQEGNDPNFMTDVYGARVSREGVVLDPGGVHIAGDGFAFLGGPDVAFDGTNHLVVWDGVDGIDGARVTREGIVIDPAGIDISPGSQGDSWPSLAFDGDNHLVVWTASGASGTEVFGARVSREGLVLDPDGIRVSPEEGSQGLPQIAFDGTNFLVAFEDNRDEGGIFGARVDRAGVVLDPSGFPVDRGYRTPGAIGFDGTDYLVVWSALHQDWDVEAARVSQAGDVRDGVPIAVSTAAGAQTAPAIGFDGTNHLVVWEDHRADSTDIYAARVAPDGAMLDGTGIPVGTGSAEQRTPAVAFDGDNYLVAWQERAGGTMSIVTALVSTDGVVGGGTTVFSGTAQQDQDPDPDVAFGGTNFLVVWAFNGIRGARVDRGGGNLDPIFPIPIAAGGGAGRRDPVVAFDGTNHLVVWDSSSSIHGKRVSPAGRVVDTTPLVIAQGGSPPVNRTPALAFSGTEYLVVWQENWTGNRQTIVGRRVSPAGELVGPYDIRLPPDPGNSSDPEVAFNGSFLVVWKDGRPRSTAYDVYGARVRRDGTVADAEAFPVSIQDGHEFGAAVAAGPDGHWGVVYHRFVDEAPYRSHRALLRDVAPK